MSWVCYPFRSRLGPFLSIGFLLVLSTTQANAFLPRPSLDLRNTFKIDVMSLRKNMSNSQGQPTVPFVRGGSSSPSKLHSSPSSVVFDNASLWTYSAVIAGLNGLGFIISLATGSHLHLDLLGTGAFAVAALQPLLFSSPSSNGVSIASIGRIQLSCGAVAVWGTKLASFLFYRALLLKHDARLTDTLSTTSGTAAFWFVSTMWGLVCSLPHSLGTTSSSPGNPLCTKLGIGMYVLGILVETLSDFQKWMFKANNPGQFCNVGLWSISQHPNFFGNLLLWSGIFLLNAPALLEPTKSSTAAGSWWQYLWGARRLILALAGPAFMWILFSGQANGTITSAVEIANKKYGHDPVYQEYVESVPLIIPNPFR